jgi:hypothetical protein
VPPAASGGGYNLLHPLMTERKSIGNHAKRGAGEVEPTYGRVVICAGQQSRPLGVSEVATSGFGPLQEIGV